VWEGQTSTLLCAKQPQEGAAQWLARDARTGGHAWQQVSACIGVGYSALGSCSTAQIMHAAVSTAAHERKNSPAPHPPPGRHPSPHPGEPSPRRSCRLQHRTAGRRKRRETRASAAVCGTRRKLCCCCCLGGAAATPTQDTHLPSLDVGLDIPLVCSRKKGRGQAQQQVSARPDVRTRHNSRPARGHSGACPTWGPHGGCWIRRAQVGGP
jgi:hypothetical protein